MPMKTLGCVLVASGALLAAGCAGQKAAVAPTGSTSSVGTDIHQPVGEEHVQTFDLHRTGKPDVWVY